MMNIETDINQKAEEEKFSGVISIFKNDTEIFCKAFGYRDCSNNLLNEKNTKFGIASGTKLFTALGIGKLIDQNVITLDTKIKEIDREYCTFIDQDATILHLLTHSSGIFDYYDEETLKYSDDFFVKIPWYELENPTDYLPLFENQKIKFKPGERFSYSNGGFVFLAILIERFAGKTYREFMQKNILNPLNMNNSGFFALNELPTNTAFGYKSNRKTTNIYNVPIRGGGDGGMFTNTYDLKKFWKQLFSYRILSKELTEKYLETQWIFNQKDGYGCGVYKKLDDSIFYIVGGDPGVGFHSRYLPNENIVINVISNITDGEEELSQYIGANLEDIKRVV